MTNLSNLHDLSDQSEVLSIIFESTHVLVAYLDADLRFVKVNRAYAAADQKPADYFVGKKHFDLYPNEENEKIFWRVIETGEPHFSYAKAFEYEHNPERGISHWDWSLLPSRDSNNNVMGAVLQLVNVTERIHAEQQLKQQDLLMETFFSQSLDGCFFMLMDEPIDWRSNSDKEHLLDYVFAHQRVTRINDAMLAQYGAARENFLKLTPNDLFAHNLEYGRQLWRTLFDQGRLAIQTEEQKLDGTPMWIEGEYVCIYDDQGRITGHFGVQREITAQKHMEEEVRVKKERLKEAQRLAKVGSWELDLRTNRLFWTDEIFNLFELDEKVFGASYEAFLDAIHPDDREAVNSAYQQSLKDREPYLIIHRLLMADGRIKWVEERCYTEFDQNGAPLISRGTVQDITERKLNERELEKYRERLEELVAERTKELVSAQNELVRKERLATLGQLTATVSHELRNPLGAMRPSLYIIKKNTDRADEKTLNALERLERNILRCDHIIDELLDFTRISTLEIRDIAIDNWLRSLLSEQTIAPGITLKEEFTLDGKKVPMDSNRMRRALINLIDNSCQSMVDESSKLVNVDSAELTVFTRETGDSIEIGVSDTGIGIADEVLPYVFEPLYSTKGFGVGLGMPTVKQIIEQHGGKINIQTKTNCGTTVVLSLPKAGPDLTPHGAR